MKKTLLFLLMSMSLSLTIHAQSAQSRLDLPETQKIMGHYESDAVGTEGVGVPTTSGKVSIGVILESDEIDIFNGGQIMAFRVGLAESTPVSKVFVVPISAGGAYGSMISWNCDVSSPGWNMVELPSPYKLNIPDDGKLLIGFEYEQPTKTSKPLAMVHEGEIYDTYWYKKAGSQYRWTTAGLSPYGNLCVQCIVERDHFPNVIIKARGLEVPAYVNIGEDMPYSFQVKNRDTKALAAQALTFDLKLDGEKLATITNPEEIAAGATVTLDGVVVTDDLSTGTHTLTIDNALAGEEVLDYVYPMNASFVAFNGVYPRQKHLVEQLTSTYCMYCPLGNSMLELLTSQRDDIVWVGIHGELNGGKDPFMSDQADSIMACLSSAISYPSGAFDRSTGYESVNQVINSLGYYEQYHQQIADELSLFFDNLAAQNPSFASINIEPVVDLDTREAVITVSGEMSSDIDLLLGEGNKLTVYITEDNLVARQNNNGKWEANYVHNGVFRCALGSVLGVDLNKTENGYCNEFTCTIPEDWNIKNLNVVAIISRPLINGADHNYTDMKVNNVEKVPLVVIPGAVDEILYAGDAVPVEYYDVMGRRMDSLGHGINSVRMSDGTTIKVLIK